MSTVGSERKPSAWAAYEVFAVIATTVRIEAASPEQAMEKFHELSLCEIAESGKLEVLDPILANEEDGHE